MKFTPTIEICIIFHLFLPKKEKVIYFALYEKLTSVEDCSLCFTVTSEKDSFPILLHCSTD